MSSGISNTYLTTWNDEVHSLFAVQKSNLRDVVRTAKNVTGNSYKFHKIGGGAVTNGKTIDADLALAGVTHSVATATLTTCHAAERFDDLQSFMTNVDYRTDYLRELTRLVSVELDARILAVADAAASTVTLTSNALDAAGIAKINKAFNEAAVPMDGDRILVIPPSGLEDMQNDTKLASRDFLVDQALQKGMINNVSGAKVIVLPASYFVAGSSTRYGLGFHKSAIGLAMGADITSMFERIPLKDAWQAMVKMLAGAVAIDATGIFKFQIAD